MFVIEVDASSQPEAGGNKSCFLQIQKCHEWTPQLRTSAEEVPCFAIRETGALEVGGRMVICLI